jgi:hypothetical protein
MRPNRSSSVIRSSVALARSSGEGDCAKEGNVSNTQLTQTAASVDGLLMADVMVNSPRSNGDNGAYTHL